MKPARSLALAAWFALSAASSLAQVARPTGPAADDTIELSPFVIRADADEGYAPNETLSGTRLRTQTRDVASAMTIVTPEFLHDVGALTFNDVADFLPSTASYANNEGDQFNNGSRTGTPFIVRGYRSDSLSTDFFTALTPIDTYNTSRLTFSRGPNSILFGVGNPGGVIDVATNKADVSRRFGTVSFRADSFDSVRGAIDANLPLIPRKLGLRLGLLHDDRGRNIKPSKDRRDSIFLAGTLQPTHSTSVYANFEANQIRQQLPRPYVTFDWYNTWAAAGRPLVATAATTTPVSGVEFQVTNGFPVYVPGVGALDWSRSAYGARPLVNGTRDGQVSFGVGSPNKPVPLDTYVMGDGDAVRLNTHSFSLVVQQRLAEGLNLEIGGKHEFSSRENMESQATGADDAIKVDANRQLPNGQSNPNVGLPYVELTGNVTKIPTYDEQLRATLAYERDFSDVKVFNRGLGKFTVAGLYSNEATHQYLDNFRLVNETPLAISTSDLSNARNLIRYRSYLTDGNTYFTSRFPTFDENGIKAGWEPVNTPRNNFTRLKSYALAGQAIVDDDLLALTAGWRRDEALVGQYNYTKDARGLYTAGGSHGGSPAPDINSVGRPYLIGAVFNPIKSLSLFANKSTNFQPVNQSSRTILDTPLPAIRGRGFDAGVKFFLLGDRITGSVDYFETEQENVRDSTVNTTNMVNWINAIWTAIDPAQRPDSGWTDTKRTKTHGVEFQLVANPTRSLRLMLNVSRDINVLEDHGATTYAYLESNYPVWNARASTPVSSPDGATVGALVTRLQQEQSDQLQANGIRQTRVYEWQANLIGRYQLDGVLPWKGFAAGTAARWRNAPIIGFARNGTLLDTNRPFKGTAFTNVDAWVEYTRTFTMAGKRVRWSAELRIQNLWDDRTLLPWRAVDDGTGQAFIEQRRTPGERQFVAATSFSF